MRPPRLVDWVLMRLLPEESGEAIVGDLHETFARDRVALRGRLRAMAWYGRAALRSLLPVTRADITRPLPPPGYRRQGGLLPNLNSDIRYAVRLLTQSPGFTLVAVLLLATGITVNATVFSLVDMYLEHPVPGVEAPRELVRFRPRQLTRESPKMPGALTRAQVEEVAAAAPTLVGIGASAMVAGDLDSGGAIANSDLRLVTDDYFAVWHPSLALGRYLDPTGGVDEAVIGYKLWQERLGGRADIIGHVVRVSAHSFTVVGVTAPAVAEHWHAIWVSDRTLPMLRGGLSQDGRMSPELLRYEEIIGRRRSADNPLPAVMQEAPGRTVTGVFAGHGQTFREVMRQTAVLRYLATLTLIAASVNVALLLVGRGMARRREIGVRLALGASRARLMRLMLVESMLLGLAAATAGLMGARGLTFVLSGYWPFALADLTISWRAVLATTILAVLAAMLLALLPSLHAIRYATAEIVRAGAGGASRTRSSLQRTFVVFEVALSMGLASAVIVFLNVAARHLGRDGGFSVDANHLSTTVYYARGSRLYPDLATQATALDERVGHIAGVRSVAFSTTRFDGSYSQPVPVLIPGPGGILDADESFVSTGFFGTSGIDVLEGPDMLDSPPVDEHEPVWIDATIAAALWPEGRAVGRRFTIREIVHRRTPADTVARDLVVAGVVGRMTKASYSEGGNPAIYRPLSRAMSSVRRGTWLTITIAIHPGARATETVMHELRGVAEDIRFMPLQTTAQMTAEGRRQIRTILGSMSASATVTLLMAFAGLYALVAFWVGQRTREIGVRMALGARRVQVLGLFFREGFQLAVIGSCIGVPVALGFLAWGPIGGDQMPDYVMAPDVLLVTVAVVMGVCALACLIPARRALLVDPMVAVRDE